MLCDTHGLVRRKTEPVSWEKWSNGCSRQGTPQPHAEAGIHKKKRIKYLCSITSPGIGIINPNEIFKF